MNESIKSRSSPSFETYLLDGLLGHRSLAAQLLRQRLVVLIELQGERSQQVLRTPGAPPGEFLMKKQPEANGAQHLFGGRCCSFSRGHRSNAVLLKQYP
jgi:hypothetical protein